MQRYLEALNRLCQPIRKVDWDFNLRPMRELLAAMGNPQQNLRAVVVTGSSGKGSTCAGMAHLLRANGRTVGLYTSPHLHSFRERFVFNGERISFDDFVAGAEIVQQAASQIEHRFSTFENATALALWWFARQTPDIVVLETGLGGRFDAVNVVENKLALFTHIEAEHAALLGGSLDSVAWHKAGIIRPSGQAISVAQSLPVATILRHEAETQQANLSFVEDTALVVTACQTLAELGLVPPLRVESAGDVSLLPGRLEQVTVAGRRVLIDGGHTPEAGRYLYNEIIHLCGATAPVQMVIGLLDDKNAAGYLKTFDSPRFHITLTRAPGHRGADPGSLVAQGIFRQAQVTVEPSLSAALAEVHEGSQNLFVVAGSLRMAAIARETYGLLDANELAEARATRAIFEGEGYLGKLS